MLDLDAVRSQIERCWYPSDLAQPIQSLLAEVERLRAVLEPFAGLLPGGLDGVGGGTLVRPEVKVEWIKNARARLCAEDVPLASDPDDYPLF